MLGIGRSATIGLNSVWQGISVVDDDHGPAAASAARSRACVGACAATRGAPSVGPPLYRSTAGVSDAWTPYRDALRQLWCRDDGGTLR
jgi:hypothetical protein